MKSKENNQGVKTGVPASTASSVGPKNASPGVSTGGGSDQISSGIGSTNNTQGGQLKNIVQNNTTTDSDSNSDNHCGAGSGGGIGGGGSINNPHSVGSSVSGGDRGTPIGTPGIGHPPRYNIFINYQK